MEIEKDASGKVVFHYIGVSYLCETEQHKLCGGFCDCHCHIGRSNE